MKRPTYHHGDLRAALVSAGLELTRDGGPDALGIRELTRRVGVSPNAAYRHFDGHDDLLAAVAGEIQDRMAEGMAAPRPRGGTRQTRARARLRSVGLGYIDFALDEPGWFAVAFFGAGRDALDAAGQERRPPPYVALVECLDGLVDAGVLTERQREGAEWPCWSAAHGFAEIALRGPLRGVPIDELRQLAARTVDAAIAGLEAT